MSKFKRSLTPLLLAVMAVTGVFYPAPQSFATENCVEDGYENYTPETAYPGEGFVFGTACAPNTDYYSLGTLPMYATIDLWADAYEAEALNNGEFIASPGLTVDLIIWDGSTETLVTSSTLMTTEENNYASGLSHQVTQEAEYMLRINGIEETDLVYYIFPSVQRYPNLVASDFEYRRHNNAIRFTVSNTTDDDLTGEYNISNARTRIYVRNLETAGSENPGVLWNYAWGQDNGISGVLDARSRAFLSAYGSKRFVVYTEDLMLVEGYNLLTVHVDAKNEGEDDNGYVVEGNEEDNYDHLCLLAESDGEGSMSYEEASLNTCRTELGLLSL
ncbi:hypothetical protein IPG41_04345 [Candidatus Peregrinibacteria bacterium]|nr:MAG: hypothetical protein IPG41_04345 [Candidatus Peregrinibacteria bacterium]